MAGLAVGAVAILSSYLPVALPAGLEPAAVRLIGITLTMGIWWVTEALPIGATALVPAATFPLLSIAPARPTTQAYMSPIIMLLFGGFLMALAVERSNAHRRLALHVLLGLGTSPRRLVLGFGVAAGLMSMWISNTATSLLMMPIAVAVVNQAEREGGDGARAVHRFGIAILLAVAYGASVGGMATPVGTPPNLIAMAALERTQASTLTFATWSLRALPAVVIILLLVCWVLVKVSPGVSARLALGAEESLRRQLGTLGPWRPSEWRSLAVFACVAVLWITRPDLQWGADTTVLGWASRLGLQGTHDGTIAMLGALLVFLLPDGETGERLLPWSTAQRAPWGLLLLFGGGVSLSVGFQATGLSEYLGSSMAAWIGASWPLFVALVCLGCTFGTEIISNTALANIAMPILVATAVAADRDPRGLLLASAMSCSCAFMMPMATGPNAIVFGSGRLRVADMVRAGLLCNLLAWAVIVAAAMISYPN